MKYNISLRTKVVAVVIILSAFILIGKLFLLQVVQGSVYEEEATKQYFTKASDIFERGTIFFQDKDGNLVSAGMQASGFGVEIKPDKITDPETTLEKLSSVITIDEEEFLSKANKKSDPFEVVARRVKDREAEAINGLGLSGVTVFKDKWRFYPGGNLAAHTLGFVAYKGNELAGRYGLESQYEDYLTRNEDSPYVNFFAEVFSNIKETFFTDEKGEGDVVTTIEPVVQATLEKEISLVQGNYSADAVGGIIMNPKTGAIYAMSAKPDFDLNSFSETEDISLFNNPLVENVLEFGSVVKPLVMASAIDAGVINSETSYNDTGSVWIEKKEIFNFDKKGRGPSTTMQDVLSQSLNTGMVLVYQKLGKEKMKDYLLSFGIGEETNIDLPNETRGLTSNLNSPRDIEYANASFGQGLALTPIGLIRALSAIANGGELVTPNLVENIKYESGLTESMEYRTTPTKISPETSEEITRMLVVLVDDTLQGGEAKLVHHSIAAKTGTAQVPNPDEGGYYTDRNIHSFFGYFPAYDPDFIVLLYAVYPKGVRYASQTWTDSFFNITKFLLNYYEVPPDR